MTQEQLMDEKQVIQKMLLNFERKYRRPVRSIQCVSNND